MITRIFSLMLPLMLAPLAASAADLFVFLPTDTKKEAVQQVLAETCPAFKVVAFDRANTFWRTYRKTPPQAVVTTGLAFSQMTDFSVVSTGRVGTSSNGTSHQLVSAKQMPPTLAKLSDAKIGVLTELSRRSAREFYSQALAPNVRLKQVSKPRDLLALLTFNTAEYLLVDNRTFLYLQRISKQPLQSRNIEMNMPAAIGAVRTDTPTSLQTAMTDCLEKLNSLSYNQAFFAIGKWQ